MAESGSAFLSAPDGLPAAQALARLGCTSRKVWVLRQRIVSSKFLIVHASGSVVEQTTHIVTGACCTAALAKLRANLNNDNIINAHVGCGDKRTQWRSISLRMICVPGESLRKNLYTQYLRARPARRCHRLRKRPDAPAKRAPTHLNTTSMTTGTTATKSLMALSAPSTPLTL